MAPIMDHATQTNMWLLVSTVFGLALGYLLAWAYSVRETHRRLQRLGPSARISTALIINRVASIGLGVAVAVSTNLLILTNQPTVLNELAYFGCTLAAAIAAWNFVFKPT